MDGRERVLEDAVKRLRYMDPMQVRNHVRAVIATPALTVATGPYVTNDGNSTTLIYVTGTVPIFYAGSQYNIPVDIWVPVRYPSEGPIVFVRPSPSMHIKPAHPHVDVAGLCYLPYLSTWKRSCSLKGLTEELTRIFSIDPPVRSGPCEVPVAYPPPARPPPPVYTPPVHSPPPQPAPAPAGLPPPPRYSPPAPPSRQVEDPVEELRRALVGEVQKKLEASVKSYSAEASGSVKLLHAQQSAYTNEHSTAASSLATQAERKAQLLQRQSTATIEMQELIDSLERIANIDDVDVATQPPDALSVQLVACIGGELAAGDMLLALDRALGTGSVPLDDYLKRVRRVAHDEFLAEALQRKCIAARTAQQRASAPAALTGSAMYGGGMPGRLVR